MDNHFRVSAHVLASKISKVEIYAGLPYVPDEDVNAHITKCLKEHPLKFDGVAWKLWSSEFNVSSRVLKFVVGLGRYSQYIFTNLDPKFRKGFDTPYWFHALALGPLVITSDSKILLSRRPLDAYLSPGKLDFPCGHPTYEEEEPSSSVLLRALDSIVARHVGAPLRIVSTMPLIHVREEPKQADDLVFLVHVYETSEEVKNLFPKAEFIGFLPDEMDALLQDAHLLAPPLPQALLYLGRHEFGEEWFQRYCLEAN